MREEVVFEGLLGDRVDVQRLAGAFENAQGSFIECHPESVSWPGVCPRRVDAGSEGVSGPHGRRFTPRAPHPTLKNPRRSANLPRYAFRAGHGRGSVRPKSTEEARRTSGAQAARARPPPVNESVSCRGCRSTILGVGGRTGRAWSRRGEEPHDGANRPRGQLEAQPGLSGEPRAGVRARGSAVLDPRPARRAGPGDRRRRRAPAGRRGEPLRRGHRAVRPGRAAVPLVLRRRADHRRRERGAGGGPPRRAGGALPGEPGPADAGGRRGVRGRAGRARPRRLGVRPLARPGSARDQPAPGRHPGGQAAGQARRVAGQGGPAGPARGDRAPLRRAAGSPRRTGAERAAAPVRAARPEPAHRGLPQGWRALHAARHRPAGAVPGAARAGGVRAAALPGADRLRARRLGAHRGPRPPLRARRGLAGLDRAALRSRPREADAARRPPLAGGPSPDRGARLPRGGGRLRRRGRRPQPRPGRQSLPGFAL